MGKYWFKKRALPRRSYLMAVAAFALIGVAGGYLYYALVGCRSGACAITSNPVLSMIWGGLMGYLLTDFFVSPGKQEA